ncbi:MAG: cbb3-type cytochrome c oxidase subunit II [Thermaceae bacterium]|nr:cbb3-type cytochrome c oxidase subunit II [Thermaceae bacterium]
MPEPMDPGVPRHPKTWRRPPKKLMQMGPGIVSLGALAVFFLVVGFVVVLPLTTFEPSANANATELSEAAWRGKQVFQKNGCFLCHSNFSRPQDYEVGQYYVYNRISEAGDWPGAKWTPNLFGTVRTGPDLSQEGGLHPDDWHYAHFWNPRYANPPSLMPQFKFLSEAEVADLTAFMQELGGKAAAARRLHQQNMKALNVAVNNLPGGNRGPAGVPGNGPTPGAIHNLMTMERGYWFHENPLPVNEQNLLRGKVLYLQMCTGCHGPQGDGKGPARSFANPQPPGFNVANDQMHGSDTSPGAYYWRILRGVPGALMENFGNRLTVEDTWRLTLFIKTIPNGTLKEVGSVPKPEQYITWQGYGALFPWAEKFYPLGSATLKAYDSEAVGGPVAAMVKEGRINPTYAVALWMLEHPGMIPASSQGYENVTLDVIMQQATERQKTTPGWAVQGVDQTPFIPRKWLDPSTISPATLPQVWKEAKP